MSSWPEFEIKYEDVPKRTKPATKSRHLALETRLGDLLLAYGDAECRHDKEMAPLHPDQEERAGDLAGKAHQRVDDCRHMLPTKTYFYQI